MHLISGSIILGFLRLCFILLFFYYLNRKFVNRSESNNIIEFIAHHWFRYGSIVAIMLFVTVQLSIYNLFNCLIILTLIVTADLIGMKNLSRFRDYVNEKLDSGLFALLKSIELRQPKFAWLKITRSKSSRIRGYYIFTLIAILAVITFGSRYYFIKYDMYSLSGVWLTDLEKVKDFDFQVWFLNDTSASGDYAFANFYSKLVDVSPEIALQSMALLESTLIGALMFWLIRKCTPSKVIAPIVASMSFALAYVLTPVNIYFLLQSKPLFLALTFGLPVMVYLLKPGLLKFRKFNYFFAMLLAFIAIGLMDLFTLVILFPPFLVLAAIFTRRKSKKYFKLGVLAYLAACLVLLISYAIICIFIHADLEMFIHNSLVSISSYTYIPQLIIPFDVLIGYCQIASIVFIAIILIYMVFLKEKNWNAALAFLIYFNVIVLISSFKESPWIDSDLVNETLSVFMHIVGGIGVAVVVRLFKSISLKTSQYSPVTAVVVICSLLFVAVYYQKDVIGKLDQIDTTPKQVLDAYDKISTTFFPYSYAVVNDQSTQAISTNKHFFMNYTDFIYEYPKQDSIYFANIKDPMFLKKNPEYALPKSVLLFVFKGSTDDEYANDRDIAASLMEQLAMLKKRGRKVQLFYENRNVVVYEIVNEDGASKIRDLIF